MASRGETTVSRRLSGIHSPLFHPHSLLSGSRSERGTARSPAIEWHSPGETCRDGRGMPPSEAADPIPRSCRPVPCSSDAIPHGNMPRGTGNASFRGCGSHSPELFIRSPLLRWHSPRGTSQVDGDCFLERSPDLIPWGERLAQTGNAPFPGRSSASCPVIPFAAGAP
jgi:hypothetical protein